MRTLHSIAFAVAAALLHLWPAAAQFGDGLTQAAIGVQAYEKSAERCFYEPVVGRALDRLREHYAGTEPYRWRRAVRESADAGDMVSNLMGLALQGSPYTLDPNAQAAPKPAAPADKDCAASGLSVGSALPFAGPLLGFDPVLFGEADRLMEGKGKPRDITGAAPADGLSSDPPNSVMARSTAPGPADTFSYTCRVDGKSLTVKIDDARKTLSWRGKIYRIRVQEGCAKFGWRAERPGETFDFCTATQGYADFQEGDRTIQCDQDR